MKHVPILHTLLEVAPAIIGERQASDLSRLVKSLMTQRLGQADMADWKGTPESGPEPKYRGYPAPVTNPFFPFCVWPYGGSVTISYLWTQSGSLMEAIWSSKEGEKWKKTGIQIYGWINGGLNVSTSTNGHYANARAAYYVVHPDRHQPDIQIVRSLALPDRTVGRQ